MEDRISEWLQHCYKMYCKKDGHYERWALYNWEVISLQGCNFQMDGLAYNRQYYNSSF